MTPPLAHRLGTRLISLGVLFHGYGTLLLVRRTRPARVTMRTGGVIRRRINDQVICTPRGFTHGFRVTARCPAEAAEVLFAAYLDLNAERRTV